MRDEGAVRLDLLMHLAQPFVIAVDAEVRHRPDPNDRLILALSPTSRRVDQMLAVAWSDAMSAASGATAPGTRGEQLKTPRFASNNSFGEAGCTR